MNETKIDVPPVNLSPQETLPPAPKKRGFFTHIYEAILALFVLAGAGAAMGFYFFIRFLFRWLLWFPFHILQTALYIILYYFRNFAALVIALLVIAGGIGYVIDVNLKQDLGIEGIVKKTGSYFSDNEKKKEFTTLASITQKERMPSELDSVMTLALSPQEIDAFVDVIESGRLGARGEGAIPLLARLLYREDEKARMAAYEALRRIGTKEAIQAINDYYAAAKKASHGKNSGH